MTKNEILELLHHNAEYPRSQKSFPQIMRNKERKNTQNIIDATNDMANILAHQFVSLEPYNHLD